MKKNIIFDIPWGGGGKGILGLEKKPEFDLGLSETFSGGEG
jgi:hypothetical protein